MAIQQAKQQVSDVQQAMNNIDKRKKSLAGDLSNTQPNRTSTGATGSSALLSDWVGQVSIVEENAELIRSYLQMVTGKRFVQSIIRSVLAAIDETNKERDLVETDQYVLFKDTTAVAHFDETNVFNYHVKFYSLNDERVAKLSPSNDRMAHEWGQKILGKVAWDGKEANQWLIANGLDPKTQGKVAFFKREKIAKPTK